MRNRYRGPFRPCELLSSLFVRRPSVNISHFNLLLRNHCANCNQTLVEWSLDGPLPNLCLTSNQDGLILKGTHPGTIPARFDLIWFIGFRGEDLNVIFYQNMPNLHNRYKSAERKISQKNPEYMLNYSLPCKLWWNGPWMAPFQICVWPPTKMATKLKIEKRGDAILIVHCCFSICQNELKYVAAVKIWAQFGL
jgi:hypothetical protein